ncbi:MAG: hypothetical protein IT303_19085 [Dehalococcoidia bacterium]|nr:hypothetical protein [Dehalococcoidia bacterium]
MRPPIPHTLQVVAGTLATQVLPEARTPFGQQAVGLAAQLCVLISQEFDRAVARLVEENGAVVALFARATDVVPAGELRDRLAAAAATPVPGPDLRVSALQVVNDDLRRMLIDLHAAVEQLATPEARALDAAIWDELRASTQRRHLMQG